MSKTYSSNRSGNYFSNSVKSKFFIFLSIFTFCFAFSDLVFIYLSKSSYNGVVTEDAYNKGIEYNKVLALNALQSKLEWKGDIVGLKCQRYNARILDKNKELMVRNEARIYLSDKLNKVLVNNEECEIKFMLTDKHSPIMGANVNAELRRPTSDKYDANISLSERAI